MDTRRLRRLLVALNAAEEVPRDHALRLAKRPSRWLVGEEKAVASSLGLRPGVIRKARRIARDAVGLYATEQRRAQKADASILCLADTGFPPDLADLELPPAVLYLRGRSLPRTPAVAIVGSRRSDVYGLEVAERFAAELAAAGVAVVSGFAVGVDGAAHRGALLGGGETVAVLGCGIDVCYPRSHRRLRERVARHGSLISEFRMGTSPEAWRFPVRNRIIAALSVGTLVVRATLRSGSLITARQALDLGREVWAVPGNISDPRSVGVNSLIRDGAQPVQEARDILESLPVGIQDRLTPPTARNDPGEDPELERSHQDILRHVPRDEPIGQDRLIAASGLSADRVIAALLRLEVDGLVRRHPGPSYCRRGAG